MRLLGSTYRWQVDGLEHYKAIVASGKQPIFAFWHGRILPATLYWKHHGIVVMISRNFDGEWITRVIRRFGYDTARGSTSRGGAKALVQLRRELAAGRPAGFSLDGPRGPARVAQPGALFLAGATAHPIMPFHIESSSAWTMNSWDGTQIPKPLARVAMAIGSPMQVPDTAERTIEDGCRRLEEQLSMLERKTLAMLNGPGRRGSR
jgi:lysophospholipid acyltransferase (LPLAT)-like uncharacterized protein